MTGRLQGKTALITGAATGMGRATAERFADEGASLILFGLGGADLDAAGKAAGAKVVHGDITSKTDVSRAIEACGESLDILVSAAGIILTDYPETVTDEGWEKTFAINVTGTMNVCRAALPLLRRRGGAIVNIASVAAFNSGPGMTSYASSKAALVAYTRSIAVAHGADGIRANVIAPGWVRTPMSDMEMDDVARANGTTREEEFENLRQRIGLRRIADASEIAACCLFLASEDASFVTGTVLVADGGGRAPVANRAV
ncbi:SDR family NAD(P)-dependent oxidoreductase [Paradevosia shaoguanensis]|uniref:SDR family NAD(P)-dependent oxidoreductase n=1 Tax=Paradevosia shaoguanensis TaxID=1335043 RepID=UPI0019331574|nr:SDR family oxidoreductase [Paradevosia shaoguanensis]